MTEVDINSLKQELNEIIKELNTPEIISDWEKFELLSKRKKKIENVVIKTEELEKIIKEEKESQLILDSETDPELVSLAESEIVILKEKKKEIEKGLNKFIAKLNDEEEEKKGSVIMEIRAGTGGDEASLFAEDLFRMYSRYAQNKNWKVKVLETSPAEVGGYKEIVFELKNGDVYSFMKNEGGVHRVQRVPETEKQGRIHTSTVSVAVLIKPQKGKLKINPADLRIDTYKSSGPGGQNVNKRETAVRITHLPTNTVAASQNERSLAQNKENAFSILEAKIMEKMEEENRSKIEKERKEQVGKADRSEKVRTYNFLQDRVTDHRVQKNWHNMESILNGNIDSIIESLQ